MLMLTIWRLCICGSLQCAACNLCQQICAKSDKLLTFCSLGTVLGYGAIIIDIAGALFHSSSAKIYQACSQSWDAPNWWPAAVLPPHWSYCSCLQPKSSQLDVVSGLFRHDSACRHVFPCIAMQCSNAQYHLSPFPILGDSFQNLFARRKSSKAYDPEFWNLSFRIQTHISNVLRSHHRWAGPWLALQMCKPHRIASCSR